MAAQIDKSELAALGEQIQAKRLELGISQREAERRLGIAHGTLASWEKGQRTPTAESIERLALFFKCPIRELFPDMPERLQSPIPRKRLALGVSARAVSQILGFSEGLVARWERGDEKPTPKNAVILARYFQCPVEEIYPEWKDLNATTQAMALRGTTPEELSKALGIRSTSLISRASGSKGASIELAARIAGALHCTVADLGLTPTKRTPRAAWRKAPPPEVVERRNALYDEYKGFIFWTMKRNTALMKASRVEPPDAYGALALALVKALDRWIEDRKEGEIVNYILTSLKYALLQECDRARSHGVKNAPKDGSFSVCSLEALLESGFFSQHLTLEARL